MGARTPGTVSGSWKEIARRPVDVLLDLVEGAKAAAEPTRERRAVVVNFMVYERR
jgi:hypothetical protein